MLEILFLIWFCKRLAEMARGKERSGGWGALGAILWVGGEIGGAIIGAKSGSDGMGLYGYALIGAVVGAIAAYVIVAALPKLPPRDFPTARVV